MVESVIVSVPGLDLEDARESGETASKESCGESRRLDEWQVKGRGHVISWTRVVPACLVLVRLLPVWIYNCLPTVVPMYHLFFDTVLPRCLEHDSISSVRN